MRPGCLLFVTISSFWLTGVDAQESRDGIPDELLCEQCPWDAPVRIQRGAFSSPRTTTVITAEDMRSLGVISVADMVNQLPNGIGAESTEVPSSAVEAPFDLGATIEGLRRLQIELIEESESNSAATEMPADDTASGKEGLSEL